MIFIAEIGMNYNGNFALCYELIKQAKYAGASIVKFQLGWRDKPGEINELDSDKIKQLYAWAKYFEIELMFSIISPKALDMIKKFNPKMIKIASRTIKENFALAKKIVNLKKKTFISLGMLKNKKKLPFKKKKNIHFLWCESKYPTDNADLANQFPKKFNSNQISGYSDHSIGIEMCLLAISRGASIIEKHFTLDKSDTTIRDHTLSATPKEFNLMTQLGSEIYKKLQLNI
jgi:N,N'-diacetyllegionaminate synthase